MTHKRSKKHIALKREPGVFVIDAFVETGSGSSRPACAMETTSQVDMELKRGHPSSDTDDDDDGKVVLRS